MEEAFIDQFSEKLQEFIVETGCIQKPDRLFVKTDLPPCKHFKKLFECSGTAGKRNDCIPEFLHHFLALMHRLHYFQVLYFFVCHLPVHEELGDDAGHFSSVVKGAVGDSAHETDSAASVYNTDAAFCKTGPEFIGGLDIDGSVPRARTAEYSDVFDFHSANSWHYYMCCPIMNGVYSSVCLFSYRVCAAISIWPLRWQHRFCGRVQSLCGAESRGACGTGNPPVESATRCCMKCSADQAAAYASYC